MNTNKLHAVTGATGYTGKYITHKLLEHGEQVITFTGNPDRANPFGSKVKTFPFNFDDPESLTASLKSVDTFYNTYWVRFDHGQKTHQKAVENTKKLFTAAKAAGVRRFVHVSISNPSIDSHLPYFKGKAELEQALKDSGLSYAVLRPTVIFGKEDILINNITWLLRHFPVFAVPGNGEYRMQPIYVEDMAELAIKVGKMNEDLTWDAVGPETFSFNELIHTILEIIQRRSWVVHVPPKTALALSKVISLFVGDVMLTNDEVDGLMANLLVSPDPPTGQTSLREWIKENKDTIGTKYASELARHYKSS